MQDGVELPDADSFLLTDDGAGADLVANDGLYSNYFVPPNQKNGDYKFKCKVAGSDGNGTSEAVTQVIEELMHTEGEVNMNMNISQHSYEDKPANLKLIKSVLMQNERSMNSNGAVLCCGSNTLRGDTVFAPTGNFSRDRELGTTSVVGLVEGEDNIAPNKITDLVAEVSEKGDSIEISFTAPGDDATFGKGGPKRVSKVS